MLFSERKDEHMEEQHQTPLLPNASGCFVASPFASETSSRMAASGPRSSQNLLVTASVPSVHGRAVVTEPSVGDEHLVFAQTELKGKTDEYNTERDVTLSDNQCNLDGHSGSSKLVTIATQTSDVYPPNSAPLVQDINDWHQNLSAPYHGGWPRENGSQSDGIVNPPVRVDTASVMSFTSSSVSSSASYRVEHHQTGTKGKMASSLLSTLMSRTLLAMSNSQDSCIDMRQSGCLPLLIQLLHGNNQDMHLLGYTRGTREARTRAAEALRNIVHSNPDEKSARHEATVLQLLEQIRAHCDQLRSSSDEEAEKQSERSGSTDIGHHHHPGSAIAALTKLSFDEEHRHAICNLGGLQAIVELLQLDAEVNGNTVEQYNIAMRRYACLALTNLTFGDGTNKTLLCSYKGATRALVSQLCSPNEKLCKAAAGVLRNLSWHADLASKKVLREVGSVVALVEAAMAVQKESTLKSILSALWNLSGHCSENKEDICGVNGALKFLVGTLTYQSPSKTLAVVENGGGILRNISSRIAVCEEYRTVLRQHDCLRILLRHLESSSLTMVNNACGTLWNLSARCAEDQQTLWDLGAVNKLCRLVQSKHKTISMGSAAALKNLLSARPEINAAGDDRMLAVVSPGLHVRRWRALEAELEARELPETCENIEGFHSRPTRSQGSHVAAKLSRVPVGGAAPHAVSSFNQSSFESSARPETRLNVGQSESQDSVGSTHSDISHDRMRMPSQLINSGYGKAELDVQQPTNYSIQFAECEDEEPSFAEEPINYSTRYTERETTSHVGYSLPETQCATSGFNDDTVTTFCTEGTPMNFLSTATSMNDLSCRGTTMAQRKVEALMVPKVGSKETAERIKSHADAECSGISGSQSTDHHTASTVVVEKEPEEVRSGQVSAADAVFLEGQSSRSGRIPSIYSYNDSTGASSPCDKPKQYCTEGTPTCLSHSSSLSSLQIPEVCEEDLPGKQVLLPKPGICLPDIDENSPLDVMNPDETTVITSRTTAEGGGAAAAASSASGHHATTTTVTFDDNNRIQETPLMFSRCSSLGSLSSFDAHSVHSSVVSEYSRRASEVVSPSDLPDSPCNTMPPSPSYKSSNTEFSPDPQEVEKTGMESQPKKPGVDSTRKLTSYPARDNSQTVLQLPMSAHPASGMQVLASGQNCEFSERSSPVAYADDGSVCAISGGTSLSALTLDDDDDAEIPRRLSRRIKPLGGENEKVSMPSTDGDARELIKTAEQLDVDDDDNSSVSEGEENMLAECISLAMPSKSSKRMVHGCSDGPIKQKVPMARRDACANRGMSCSKIITIPSLGVMSEARVTSFADRQRNAHRAVPDVVDVPGRDSPRKHATEDTTLNVSHCGSLGDSSADSSNLADITVRFIEKPETKPTVDDYSDVSSLSDSNVNYEDLLFEVIEAAMPKSKRSKKPWKPSSWKNARRSEGSGTKAAPPKAASRNPVAHLLESGAQGVRSMNGYSFLLGSTSAELDGVKTYAVEGTPIEFSRSTSLSSLTIESMDGADKDRPHLPSTKSQGAESRPHPPGGQQSIAVRNPTFFHAQNLASEDVVHSYRIEDTPAVFSRNYSLSSLSGAEDEEVMRGGSNGGAVQGVRVTKPMENTVRDEMVSTSPAACRNSPESPTVARLRTPCTTGLRIFSSGTNLTSTPVDKQMGSPIGGLEDQVVQYAVEGTPENISRNLSPRFTVSHNRNVTELEQSACFLVEGTQRWTGPPGHREKSRWAGPEGLFVQYNRLTNLRNACSCKYTM